MNQYRCNNYCNHLSVECVCDFVCDIADEVITEEERKFIEKVGCASHSDFQREREKVLDNLEKWRKKLKREHYGISHDWLRDKIEALRQEGKP